MPNDVVPQVIPSRLHEVYVNRIPEKDWKAFRRIFLRAIDRFAKRTLDECRRIIDSGDKEAMDRMEALFELLGQKDERLRDLELHFRRSYALVCLTQLSALDLLDQEDLDSLAPETRAHILDCGLSDRESSD